MAVGKKDWLTTKHNITQPIAVFADAVANDGTVTAPTADRVWMTGSMCREWMVMAMREKLIEAIKSIPRLCWTEGAVEVFADHLIANGVTIADDRPKFFISQNKNSTEELAQIIGSSPVILLAGEDSIIPIHPGRWIPVTERLPELHTKVLCCGKKGGRFIAELSTWGKEEHLCWDKRNGQGCPTVTHWMPLPEPPKEV